MAVRQPTVSLTPDALVIRIPWQVVQIGPEGSSRRRRMTVEDVLELVEAGRLAHRLGNTRLISSLQELTR